MRRSGWFYYACIVWGAALLSALTACFIGMHNMFALVLFLIIPEWFAMIHTDNRESLSQHEILHNCPKNCKVLVVCCIAYGIINFLLGMFLLREGGPQIHDGMYCLWDHGFIREITYVEYKSLLRAEGRMFTGMYLLFSSISMAYFAARDKINHMTTK